MRFLLPILLAAFSAAEQLAQENWPNLIIPIDSAQPNKAFGTQFSGSVAFSANPSPGHILGSLILFDNVPAIPGVSYCTISFQTSPTGPITLSPSSANPLEFGIFPVYGGFVDQSNTWNSHPSIGENPYAIVAIEDGVASTSDNSVPCVGGKAQFAVMPIEDLGGEYAFSWFELNDPANGLFNGITYRQWK